MDPKTMALGLLWYVIFLFSTTCHEAAHAWAAMRGGDRTAMLAGQVTLNPIPHMRREFFGTVVIPFLSFFLSGFMLGWASAPFDPRWEHRYPRRAAAMAIAGPLANLFLVILSGCLLIAGLNVGAFIPGTEVFSFVVAAPDSALGGFAQALSIAFILNLILFVFNLFPVPPLDGSTAIGLVLPEDTMRTLQRKMRTPMASLIGFVVAWNLFEVVFRPVLKGAIAMVLGT